MFVGVSNDCLLVAGGANFPEEPLLNWENDALKITSYPPLPYPLSEMTGTLLRRTIHLVGGTRKPGATAAESLHLMLDLDALEKGWSQQTFPGSARILAVSAATEDAFVVMSGSTLEADENGKPKRSYLQDA